MDTLEMNGDRNLRGSVGRVSNWVGRTYIGDKI